MRMLRCEAFVARYEFCCVGRLRFSVFVCVCVRVSGVQCLRFFWPAVRGSDKPSIVVNGVVCLNGQSCQLINGAVGFGTGQNEERHSTLKLLFQMACLVDWFKESEQEGI